MEFNWDDFKSKYPNEQEARQGFTKLCGILMDKNFPEFEIKNSDNILEENNAVDKLLQKECKVYLSKYFLDGVSNSRKGQIRKSLNDNLPYMKANKITEWYLLMPLEFSPEEKNWWENWSLRIKQENGITPHAILSERIVDMISDLLDYDYPGTESIPKKNLRREAEPEPEPEVSDDTLLIVEEEPSVQETSVEVAEPVVVVIPADDDAQTSKTTVTTVTETTETTVTTKFTKTVQNPGMSGFVADDNADAATTVTADDTKNSKKKSAVVPEPVLSDLERTWAFKQKFEALEAEKIALPTDKDNNLREVFDKRREASNVRNYLNDFVFGDMSKFKGKELLKKGQIYITNKQYSRGLYIYEYANAKNLLDDPALKEEYVKGVDEANFKLNYKYNMINGDLLFAKRDYINAAESYNKALESIRDYEDSLSEMESLESTTYSSLIRDNEAQIKYLEANAESLLQVGEFGKAIDNFKTSLSLDPDNEQLKKRLKLAEYLENSNYFKHPLLSWLNIFIAPYFYFRARKIDPNIRELKNAEKLFRRAIWGLVILALIIALLVWLFMKGKRVINNEAQYDSNLPTVQSSATPLELCLSQGDYYLSHWKPDNPHYIDSAIYAYDRARRYDNTDTAAESGYNRALAARQSYLAEVQYNIRRDSAAYYLRMRRPTEGLTLFKYKYDPYTDTTKRKFGFTDTLGNVVIAPVYDFNIAKMNGQGETFYDGKAKVCIHVGDHDVFFWIDQYGKKIEGLDENGNPIQ